MVHERRARERAKLERINNTQDYMRVEFRMAQALHGLKKLGCGLSKKGKVIEL